MATVREDLQDQIIAIRETVMDSWKDLKSFVQETWPALTILLVILIIAVWVADPAPPRHVVMATGPAGSSNQMLGQRYQQYFAQRGITLELVATEGSVENVHRLQDLQDKVMAGFVMAGAAPHHAKGIQTLGSINYQPLWCFYRSPVPLPIKERETLILSHNVNMGTPNSGTHLLMQEMLKLNHITGDLSKFKQHADEQAIELLRDGQLDSVCIVDTYESPNVQKLLKIEGLQLSEFERAEAYARMVPAIEMVTIPEGALDLSTNRPLASSPMIATTTEILIDERLHPAIQTLFLMAAKDINGKESFFSKEGQFPVFMDSTQHRSKEAEIFYEKGTPLLMEVLPFWLAEFIRRLFVTLLPFFAVAYPVIRSMPNYHKNRVRGKINRMYGALKFFEQSLVSAYDPAQKTNYLAQLDAMEREALGMKVPKSVASDYYTLRSSIDFVRNCVLRDSYNAHATPLQPPSSIEVAADDGDGDDV
jgi:TRAP-type uncharacterized transport system substrate-binding protein